MTLKNVILIYKLQAKHMQMHSEDDILVSHHAQVFR